MYRGKLMVKLSMKKNNLDLRKIKKMDSSDFVHRQSVFQFFQIRSLISLFVFRRR